MVLVCRATTKAQAKLLKSKQDLPISFPLLKFLIILFTLQFLVSLLSCPPLAHDNRIRNQCRISFLLEPESIFVPDIDFEADMQSATSGTYLETRNTMKSRNASYSVTQVT